MVTKVAEDGPAAKEDIKAGDMIVAVNGDKIDDSRDLARKIAELHPNTDVTLSIVRYGDKHQVDMKLGTFPSGKKLAALGDDKPETGMQLDNLGLSLAPAVKVPDAGADGVVITEVDPNSDAADKGLKPVTSSSKSPVRPCRNPETSPKVSRRQWTRRRTKTRRCRLVPVRHKQFRR